MFSYKLWTSIIPAVDLVPSAQQLWHNIRNFLLDCKLEIVSILLIIMTYVICFNTYSKTDNMYTGNYCKRYLHMPWDTVYMYVTWSNTFLSTKYTNLYDQFQFHQMRWTDAKNIHKLYVCHQLWM